jgi:hypothetical protein
MVWEVSIIGPDRNHKTHGDDCSASDCQLCPNLKYITKERVPHALLPSVLEANRCRISPDISIVIAWSGFPSSSTLLTFIRAHRYQSLAVSSW